MDFRSFVVFFLLLLVVKTFSHVASYGPSIEFLTRVVSGSGDKFHKQNISLINYSPTYSVLVPLVDNKAVVNYTEAIKYFKYFHYGEFLVEAPKNYGVIAVIQQLRLRKVFGEVDKCLDYISFRDTESNETDIEKICGSVDSDDDFIEKPSTMVGSRHFVSPSGKMTVRISLVSIMIKSEWVIGPGNRESTIEAEISFTAFPLWSNEDTNTIDQTVLPPLIFHGCPNGSLFYKRHPQRHVYRRCSVFVEHSCIHERLFCDDIVQCGFDSIGFGQDEQDCGKYRNEFDEYENWTHYYDSFNGTRKEKPKIIITDYPIEIEIIQDLITVLGCLVGALLIIGLVWWCYRVFVQRNVEPIPETNDKKRQSIIQMLEKRRHTIAAP